jgi:quercetin dioxygenase-like cupin family protein
MKYLLNKEETKFIAEDWGSLTWLASGELLGTEGLTVGRVVIKKGRNNPKHVHPDSEEVLYLLEGELAHSVGDEEVTVKKGGTIVIPAGVPHNAVSVGGVDADMIVAYPTNARKILHV